MTTPATIVTRETGATAKGSPLTNAEVDQNFINLRDRIEAAQAEAIATADADALALAIALG
jgi:predicted alternative tryptophan synthase beta-subunit